MCITSLSSWHPTVLLIAMYAVAIVVGTAIMQWWCVFIFVVISKGYFVSCKLASWFLFLCFSFDWLLFFVLLITICFALLRQHITFSDRFYDLCSFETALRYSSISVEFAFGLGIWPRLPWRGHDTGKSRECWFARINVNRRGAYLPWPLLCK